MTLTQKRAIARFQCIKQESISYKFHLKLLAGTNYSGLSQISFTLTSIPTQLALDTSAKQIKKVSTNGKIQTAQHINHKQGFLYLKIQNLTIGQNIVVVQYQNKYDNDGNGCVSFIDVDTKQYVYTQFQPYYANRVFVLFDQPDLKATMELNIISPMQWERVLSNQSSSVDQLFSQEKHVAQIKTQNKQLVFHFYKSATGRFSSFPKTKLLPSYLFCFVAGPYKPLVLKQTYNNIPMSLYSIQSLFSYMQGMAPFIFQVTIECMKFFQAYFGIPYPFSKYDQVFAHEYKCGAMENAAIVTFNDQYIWKQKVSVQSMLDLANTISHELSHHWFGNLSTMKWWDDLWLNQSFAEFISHFCLEKIRNNLKTIKYQSSMAAFLARKAWGYHEDQLVTTHPISGQVANTIVAVSIFDGITYSKGAATMKQLLLLMGQENFSKGLNSYFKKYGFKNATLEDFINELQHFYKNDKLTLPQWKKLWIQTASLNILQPKWNIQDKSNQSRLEIHQKPFTSQYPTLRPHKIKVALFKQDSSFDVIQVYVTNEPLTLTTYKGQNNYKAVLLNYQDHTFAKVVIDEQSLNFFSSGHLVQITDTLTRTMIWRNFYDMVKDGNISSLRYIDIFLNNIKKQSSDSIFQRHFEYVHTAINNYTPQKYRQQLNSRLFYFILNLIPEIDIKQENRLIILKSQLCNYAYDLISVKILLAWRQNKYTPLRNHQMTIVQKWVAVQRALSQKSFSHEYKKKLLQLQLSEDQSDTGKLQQAKCKCLLSNQQQFEQIYQSFKDPKNEKSISMKHSQLEGWNHCYHEQRLKKYIPRYFEQVVQVSNVLEGDHFGVFLQQVIPNSQDFEYLITGLKKIVFGDQQKYDKNRIDVLKMICQLQRRQKAYQKFQQFSPL